MENSFTLINLIIVGIHNLQNTIRAFIVMSDVL